jgi:hypothetical protein
VGCTFSALIAREERERVKMAITAAKKIFLVFMVTPPFVWF